VIERWLKDEQQREGVTELTPALSSPTAASSPVLDTAVLEHLRQIMGPEFEGVVTAYLRDIPTQIAAIQEGLAQSDRGAVEGFSQSVKASSRSIGALAVGGIAERLETHAKSHTLSDDAHRLLAALRSAFEIVSSRLRDHTGEAGGRDASGPRFVKDEFNRPVRHRT
jgi:HPt (histidine-containing phosphotransfer) domain-containing protein